MAETKKSKHDSAVFDVSRPGKSAPSSSSKPIIVTNRPVLKDPMVVDDEKTDETADAKTHSPALPSQKIKIEPIVTPPEQTHTAEADKPAEATMPEDTQDEKPSDDEPTETEASDDLPKKKNAQPDEETIKKEMERAAEIHKLVESRKYYLPINQVEKRKTKRYVLLGIVFIVILGLAWADVALDAGIITIPGVKAPTHFFQ